MENEDSFKPRAVQALEETLLGLPGLSEVEGSIHSLSGLDEALAYVDFGNLPHAAIRWAGQTKPNHSLVQFEFRLTPCEESWRTLEFLAYWVRSNSRSGINVQLRPTALPPSTPLGVQFGRTLHFQIELFGISNGDNMAPILATIAQLNDDLNAEIKNCGKVVYGPKWR